jgi:hypothetical protein
MRAALLIVVAIVLTAANASAQSVRGRVLDAGTAEGIPEVRVTLLNPAGDRVHEVITDANGRFALNAKVAGQFRIRTNHIGYMDVTTEPINVGSEEQITVDVKVAIAAVTLDALTVVARRIDPRQEATADGMYARRLLLPPIGSSRVMLPHDPEMAGAMDVRDILRWMPRQRGCMVVWWNGNMVQNQELAAEYLEMSPQQLEAVEFYRSFTDAPLVYRDLPITMGFSNTNCSVVVLWPRTNRYLAEFAPPILPPDMSAYSLSVVAYRPSGPFAPSAGFGIEASALRPISGPFFAGVFLRITAHGLNADTSAALTRHQSDATFLLPPGDRTLFLSVLGGEGKLAFRRQMPLRGSVSARLEVAQRRFNLQSSAVGNRNILITSYGWGGGVQAAAEWDMNERLSASASLGYDRLSFRAYELIETPSTPTAGSWNGIGLRLGILYSPNR